MKKLPYIPEQAYIRHPNGLLEGPFTREHITEKVKEGSVSRYIWIYDIEKRLGTALADLPEYDHYPDSSVYRLFFPHGFMIDMCYFFGILSFATAILMFLPAILTGFAGMAFGIVGHLNFGRTSKQIFKFNEQEANRRLKIGFIMNAVFFILGTLIFVNMFFLNFY